MRMRKESSQRLKQTFDAGRIWSKSDGKSLLRHIEDCLEVYRELRLALPILPSLVEGADFFDLLFCVVYLHDWGKTHVEFQKVLKKKRNQWRHNRHEIFSVPFVEMLPIASGQKNLIAESILGHHKDFETMLGYLISDEDVEEYQRNVRSQINPIDFKENLSKCLDVAYLKELKARFQKYYDRYAGGKRQFDLERVDFSAQENPIKTYARPYLVEKTEPNEERYWRQMFLSLDLQVFSA